MQLESGTHPAAQNAVVEGFSLSPQQRHLWSLLADDSGSAYRAQCTILIEGSLDRERLRAALREVTSRHEVLRTTFHNLPGMRFPVQVIAEEFAPRRDEHDLSGLSPEARDAGVERLCGELGREPFNLRDGPLVRFSLLKLRADEHLLLVSLSALCGDAATLRNLAREVAHCYDARAEGDGPGEAMQYADLSEWQNEILVGEYAAAGMEFFREQADAVALALKLPFETRPRGVPEFGPRFITSAVRPEAFSQVRELVGRYETSTPVFLLTCWYALLRHLTRAREIAVAVAYDGRGYAELESALGLFAKYLPLRARVEGGSRFDELLKEVDASARAARRRQEVFAWERLTEAAQDGERQLFAPVAFAFEQQAPKHRAAGLSFSVSREYACTERFKVKLSCVESGDALTTELHYDPALVPAHQAEDLSRRFQTLLESAVENPSAFIRQLDVLGGEERARLLYGFNDTAKETPGASSVQEMFEAQAERHPTRTAVVSGDTRLTYRELNARANRLAHYLRELGVGPETRVGLCVERSARMVVGLLGALKAGGAYVPLESDHPKARLAKQLSEARAAVLLTQESVAQRFSDFGGPVLRLDVDARLWAALPEENPRPVNTPEQLAYVLYTSGSTGEPKAVGLAHRNVINYAHDTCRRLGAYESPLNFAMVTTLSADLCLTSVYGALVSGGCLHVVGYDTATSGAAMSAYVAAHEIDVLKIVPSHLGALAAGKASMMPRRYLVVGGEALSRELTRRLVGLGGGCLIVNEYGPTETTVGSVAYAFGDEGGWGEAVSVPVGRPIANTQAYVLEEWMRPVAPGVEGELYVGGAGVARGYLNAPGRTAERFVPDPLSREPGARLYRTGDLARHLPDGNLEYMGRADDQVKVSGYRVELGEVEAALKRHVGVKDALVTAADAEDGRKRLVAYVVPQGGRAHAAAQELRAHLKELLPPYMLPAAFVTLDALPLTPNGKVDRRALPRPEQHAPAAVEHVEPRDEIEGILAAVWRKVLRAEAVGVHDDYFAAGGDSIRVIQVVHELARYGLCVTAMDVFRHRTINHLARHIRELKVGGGNNPPPLELLKLPGRLAARLPAGVADAYPAARMQEFVMRHYDSDRRRAGVYHIQQSYHVYDRDLSVEALQRALEIIVQSHPALRTTFVFDRAAGPVQLVHERVPVSVAREDIRGLSPSEQDGYITDALGRDRSRPFDVREAARPLFRFAVFLRSEKTAEFFMSAHHAVADGWGNQQLLNELVEVYAALKRGEAREPSAGPNTYKEFVALEREILSSAAASGFWRDHLSEHEWRPLKKRRAASAGGGAPVNYEAALPAELAAQLKRAAVEQQVSLKSLFLSAYLDLVAGITGGGQNTVGVIANGRSERLSNPLKALGLFWNIIPFCLPAGGDGGRPARARRVQQLLVDAELYARYPLPQIMKERRARELFSATFNFLHFHNASGDKFDGDFRLLGQRQHDKFHFPLNLVVAVDPSGGGVGLRVEYDGRYFDGETVRAMAGDYVSLLGGHA